MIHTIGHDVGGTVVRLVTPKDSGDEPIVDIQPWGRGAHLMLTLAEAQTAVGLMKKASDLGEWFRGKQAAGRPIHEIEEELKGAFDGTQAHHG